MKLSKVKEMAEKYERLGIIMDEDAHLFNTKLVLQLVERVEKLSDALKFYAGLSGDSEWDGCKFLTFDKFGGLCEELTGPRIAKEDLSLYGSEVPLC